MTDPKRTHKTKRTHAKVIAMIETQSTSDPMYCQGQNVHQSPATQPRRTDVPDWVILLSPTFWDNDSFNFKCHGRQLASNRCNLRGGSVWGVVVQPSPGLSKIHGVGLNIALHAAPADRTSTYGVSAFLIH